MTPRVMGLVLGLVVVAGCGSGAEKSTATSSNSPPTFETSAPTFAPTFVPTTSLPTTTTITANPPPTTNVDAPTPSAPLASGNDGAAMLTALDTLVVAGEERADTYDRDLFGGAWIDADGDGCDTRCEVLEAERTQLPGGQSGWLSVYDNYPITRAAEVDIDHMIPLAEAWRSGAWAWEPGRRIAFANDLDEPRALLAVSTVTNRSKSDSDPAGWKPANVMAWCGYADAWVAVKQKWELTADPAEVAALKAMVADRDC